MTGIPKDMKMRNLRQKLDSSARRFRRDQGGSAMMLFAFFLMVGAGFAAIAIDGGYVYSLKSKLQTTADAAVLVAVGELPDTDVARTAAIVMAGQNMPTGEHGAVLANADVVTGNWASGTRTFTAGGTPLNAVRVVTRRSQVNGNAAGLFFARILGFNQVDVETTAVATIPNGGACLISLDPNASNAVKVNNGTVIANGCDLQVNSSDPEALKVFSNGTLEADAMCVTGDYTSAGTMSTTPDTGCDAKPDPLAGLQAPSFSDSVCDYNDTVINGASATFSPGVYCGGITLTNADVTFQPGTYIIKDGDFRGSAAYDMAGEGVTFFFSDDAALKLAGQGGDIDLSAPTTGPLAGILFFGDPDAPEGVRHNISGGSDVSYEGTMYFPTGDLDFTGNGTGSTNADYTMVIARQLSFGGNGSLTFNSDYDDSDVPLPALLRRPKLVF